MSSPKATITTVTAETDTTRRIAALEIEQRRYPYSPVFKETIELLRKSELNKPTLEKQVSISMSVDQAEKLYGLLGSVTAHSGFDPIFQALDKANFSLRRQRPKLHFVRDNVITAEF